MPTSATLCRLCGGTVHPAMNATIMGKHDIGYHICDACGSMQTDPPTWLEEAYAKRGIGFDNSMATRTIQLVIDTIALLHQFRFDREKLFVDFGGGTGIFTRLMRDHGFNFFHHDKYEEPYFSGRFTLPDLDPYRPHVVTAFEVFEHLPEPAQTIHSLLIKAPELVLFGTDIFHAPPSLDWPYLALPSGQHVFFYSEKALEKTAARYGYVFRNLGFIKLFAHPGWIKELTTQGGDFEGVCALVRGNRPAFDNYAINLFANNHLFLTHGMRSREHEQPKAAG